MSDYSLELASECIPDSRTKRYFSEVMVSYSSGCLRSSIVMLWSVVVCDILFKLTQIAEQHNDATAKAILTEIESTRAANPKSPEWEWKLVEQVKTRTQLLEAGDYANLDALHKHRHLSAHPVLSASEVLFEPNKETARAHIRNALEGVLTKPSIMTKKILETFLEDLEMNADILPDKTSLTKYLSAKYFAHLIPVVEGTIFRSLWRLIFRSEDPRCARNRKINYRALSILYERRKEQLKALIGEERAYYSEVGLQEDRFDLLKKFIGSHPELFPLLTDAAKIPLKESANYSLSHFAEAWYVSPDPATHLDVVYNRINSGMEFMSGDAFSTMFETARREGLASKAVNIAIMQFGKSVTFDMADGYFKSLIKPLIQNFSKEQLIDLVKVIDTNYQIYARGRASVDHRLIGNAIDTAFESGFDYSNYPNFTDSAERNLP